MKPVIDRQRVPTGPSVVDVICSYRQLVSSGTKMLDADGS
jgi:hypothetical protein